MKRLYRLKTVPHNVQLLALVLQWALHGHYGTTKQGTIEDRNGPQMDHENSCRGTNMCVYNSS